MVRYSWPMKQLPYQTGSVAYKRDMVVTDMQQRGLIF